MSTPWTGITTIPVTDQPQQFTQGSKAQLLLLNTDENNEVWVGYNSAAAGIASSISVPPLGNITMSDLLPMYAVCDPGDTAALVVVPGGTAFAPSAVQIATQLLPLAIDIAEQIAATGIPIVAAPTLLYSAPSSALAGAGPVGATTQLNGYPSYSDRLTLAQYVDTLVDGNPALTMQKWFLLNWITSSVVGSGTHQIPTGLSELINNGCQILLCTSPTQTTGTYGVDPATISDFNSLKTTLGILKTYGATNIWCVLQQEPNSGGKFTSAAAYGAYVNYYAGAVAAESVPNVVDLATNHGTGGNYQEYFEAVTAPVNILLVDYYGNTWGPQNGNPAYLLDQAYGSSTVSLMSLADNYPGGAIPFGVGEWGNAQTGATPLPQTGPGSWPDFYNYILGLFATRLDDGKTNACVNWYSGTNTVDYNLLPDGAGYDLTAGLNAVWEAISPAATSLTVGPGATVTVPPLDPSAGGGYATLNGLSYEIIIGSEAVTGSTNPFDTVRMIFYDQDDPGALPLERSRWSMPSGQAGSGPTNISGRGPEHGQYCQLQITNHDTVSHSVTLQLLSTSRTANTHDWRWDAISSVAIPGFTLPPVGGPFSNCLGAIQGVSVPAASGGNPGTVSYLLSMYAGNAYVRFGTAATSAVISVTLTPQPSSGVFGGAVLLNEQLAGTSATSIGDYTAELILPRGPCLVTFSNSDTSAHLVYGIVTTLD